MKNWQRADVIAETTRLFPQENAETILSILDEYGITSHEYHDDPDRACVQIAVLQLSQGNVDLLLHYLNAAKEDHRDVLWWSKT